MVLPPYHALAIMYCPFFARAQLYSFALADINYDTCLMFFITREQLDIKLNSQVTLNLHMFMPASLSVFAKNTTNVGRPFCARRKLLEYLSTDNLPKVRYLEVSCDLEFL